MKESRERIKKNTNNSVIDIFGMIPIVLNQIATLNQLKAYIALSSFQGTDEESFPKIGKVADRAGLSIPAVSKAITELVSLGWVYRQKRYGKSNIYKVMIGTISKKELSKSRIEAINNARKHKGKAILNDNINGQDNHKRQDEHSIDGQYADNPVRQYVDNIDGQDDILKDHYKRPIEKTTIKEDTPRPLSFLTVRNEFYKQANLIDSHYSYKIYQDDIKVVSDYQTAIEIAYAGKPSDIEQMEASESLLKECLELVKMYKRIIEQKNNITSDLKANLSINSPVYKMAFLWQKKKSIEIVHGSIPSQPRGYEPTDDDLKRWEADFAKDAA